MCANKTSEQNNKYVTSKNEPLKRNNIAAKLTGIPTNLDTLVACTLLQEEHPRKRAMILFPNNDSSSY